MRLQLRVKSLVSGLVLSGILLTAGCANRQQRPSDPRGLVGTQRGDADASSTVDRVDGRENGGANERSYPNSSSTYDPGHSHRRNRTSDPRGLVGNDRSTTDVSREDATADQTKDEAKSDQEVPRSLDKNPEQNYRSLRDRTWPEKFDRRVQTRFLEHLRRRGWRESSPSPDNREERKQHSSTESSDRDE